MARGSLSIILHAHLPFVRHPEHEFFLEEQWLYEAITETYVPLIHMLERIERDGVPCRLAMTLSPTLIAMLTDGLLQERYRRHITRLIDLAGKEIERTRFQPEFNRIALEYFREFTLARETVFDRYGGNIVHAFKGFQDRGLVEILTCGATHGFLPLVDRSAGSVRGQIDPAVRQYRAVFQRDPAGIWLPECGYAEGIDEDLKEYGIRYFITDTHGILHASPRPKFGVYAPLYCPSRVAAFGRDLESSKQVWSSVEGYPGDYSYREFYRDIGFDLDYEYIRPYISPDGKRINTGLKYYRITGPTPDKLPYDRTAALEKAAEHAGNFMFNREKQVEHLSGFMDREPIIVAPYDAELFGHWWYEGPSFLDFLIRKIGFDQQTIRLVTPSDYLKQYPVNQVSTPSMSSWGWKGYNETWLSGSNTWIYPHLHKAARRMKEMARTHGDGDGIARRTLNQAARELLLAQSSDWAFIMHTGTMVPYAVKRTTEHLLNFDELYRGINGEGIDIDRLEELEHTDNLFPDIEPRAMRVGTD